MTGSEESRVSMATVCMNNLFSHYLVSQWLEMARTHTLAHKILTNHQTQTHTYTLLLTVIRAFACQTKNRLSLKRTHNKDTQPSYLTRSTQHLSVGLSYCVWAYFQTPKMGPLNSRSATWSRSISYLQGSKRQALHVLLSLFSSADTLSTCLHIPACSYLALV